MRLITRRKVWRAFSELDGLTDEQCRAVLRRAEGTHGARAFRKLLQVCMGLAGMLIGALVFIVIMTLIAMTGVVLGTAGMVMFGVLFPTLVIGTGALFSLGLRDAQLHACLEQHLRQPDRCHSCGYGLAGLPARAEPHSANALRLHVACPECGLAHVFHAKAGEVVVDVQGQARFARKPQPQELPFPEWVNRVADRRR